METHLRSLSGYYHNHIANIPGFLMAAMYPTSDGPLWDLAAFVNNPHLFASSHVDVSYGRQGYVLMPNIERHKDKILLMCSKEEGKRLQSKEKGPKGGISYTVWALHPATADPDQLLEEDADSPRTLARRRGRVNTFDNSNCESAHSVIFESSPSIQRISTQSVADFKDLPMPPCSYERLPSQKKETDIERESRQKYLVTILDLSDEELPWLLKVREIATDHMTMYYDYSKGDDLLMYFHFPTSADTSTLHLHVTLNKECPLHEQARSFALDDVIRHFQDGHKDVLDFVFQRRWRWLVTLGNLRARFPPQGRHGRVWWDFVVCHAWVGHRLRTHPRICYVAFGRPVPSPLHLNGVLGTILGTAM